jgi:hypothetical protein
VGVPFVFCVNFLTDMNMSYFENSFSGAAVVGRDVK